MVQTSGFVLGDLGFIGLGSMGSGIRANNKVGSIWHGCEDPDVRQGSGTVLACQDAHASSNVSILKYAQNMSSTLTCKIFRARAGRNLGLKLKIERSSQDLSLGLDDAWSDKATTKW